MRLFCKKVRSLESEQQRNHQPLWAKPRPGTFTERILNYHQENTPHRLLHWHGGSSHPHTFFPVCPRVQGPH
ncbi:unnamed protein product [Prunus armeniaca]